MGKYYLFKNIAKVVFWEYKRLDLINKDGVLMKMFESLKNGTRNVKC